MAMASETKGMGVAIQQAEAGMKLFQAELSGPTELDQAAAQAYKAEVEQRIADLDAEAAKLTGKDNKKERSAKGKQVSELKGEHRYVDACKVVKGLTPVHGHFVLSALLPPPVKEAAKVVEPTVAAPQKTAAVVKEPRKSKKEDSAGLSPAERSELEELKKSIIERKAQLAAEGKSGGQQNKDEQVVSWVKRMTELKEKDQPGSTQKDAGKKSATKKSKAPLSQEEQKHMDALQGKIEAYRLQLQKEHGYSKKEIKADPDMQDMEAELAALEKRSN